MNKKRLSIFIFLFALLIDSQAQESSVRITGSAFDYETGNKLINILVVNKTNGNGTFGDKYGDYNILIGKNDSIVISAFGYSSYMFSLKDSIPKTSYSISPTLKKPLFYLRPVTIIAERELEDIEEDIQDLGYSKEDYMLSGIDAAQSPITFLYQMFSRRERSKRLVAELANEDRKRRLLKELFRKYIDYEIIDLEDKEFDEFIDHCRVSENFMKSSSQYEFLMYIKYMYQSWGDVPRKDDLLPKIDFDKY